MPQVQFGQGVVSQYLEMLRSLTNTDSINQYLNDLVQFFEESQFFIPSEPLTEKLLARLRSLDGRDNNWVRDEEELFLQRRMIAEQIYYFVGAMSKNPKAIAGEGLQPEEIINPGLGKSIGLSNEEEDNEILRKLAEDFLSFWAQNEDIPLGWGTISIKDKKIFLTRFSNEENVSISASEPEEGVAHYFTKEGVASA